MLGLGLALTTCAAGRLLDVVLPYLLRADGPLVGRDLGPALVRAIEAQAACPMGHLLHIGTAHDELQGVRDRAVRQHAVATAALEPPAQRLALDGRLCREEDSLVPADTGMGVRVLLGLGLGLAYG